MAKWGEGDSRWLVEERKDGANVNSWHWEDRSMMSFAKQRLAELLQGLSIDVPNSTAKDSSTKMRIEVTELKDCTGECSISRRKKDKLLALFDLTLKLKWEATCYESEEGKVPNALESDQISGDGKEGDKDDGKPVKGEITIKEFATGHDEIDDLEFSCTVSGKGEQETKAKAALKKLYQPIFKCLQRFDEDLRAQDIPPPTPKQ